MGRQAALTGAPGACGESEAVARGRRLLLGRGWTIMDRSHFFHVADLWWRAGYDAGIKEAAAQRA